MACPDCGDHHWVVWSKEGKPVFENCQRCNPDQEDVSKLKDPPPYPEKK